MSFQDDRGAYIPREQPLEFDRGYARPEGRRRAPVAMIVSALILVAMIAGLALFYSSGFRKEGEAPRVVGDPVGAMIAPPPAEAQPADETAGLEVYRAENGEAAPAQPTFAPDPEQPMVRPQPPAPRPEAASPALRPAQPAAAPAATAAAPAPAKPAAAAPAKPAPAPATPAAAVPAPAATSPATPATGGAIVQIGAFSDAAQADKGWNDAARALPGAMAGKGKRVEPATVNGKAYQRTYVTGFASKAEAQAFCRQLTAAGKSCIVR
ncbi:MAG TPA: SPOR domain-containing protein [Caulobacteraceae bacterium]|jgi:cell division protein FtsN